MSYETHAIAAITDVPAFIGSFAASLGFETDLSVPTQPIIWNPENSSNSDSNSGFPTSGALRWRVTASVAGSTHTLRVDAAASTNDSNSAVFALVDSGASFTSPVVTPVTPAVVLPTVLHLIGSLLPVPYIAAVVKYVTPAGDVVYRHLYIGNMEKKGSYEGGEVISTSDGPYNSTSSRSYDDPNYKYLFQARCDSKDPTVQGGVHVEHVDNPTPWLIFDGPITSAAMTAFTAGTVLGGFGDSINDGYLARGRSPFAGQQMLAPINLYQATLIPGDTVFVPLGRPAGVRLVNMQDLQPEAEIIVGGLLWRVFPSHARRFESVSTESTNLGANPPAFETSLWVGYAYAVNEEDSNS